VFAISETWIEHESDIKNDYFTEYETFFKSASRNSKHGRAMAGMLVMIKKSLCQYFHRVNVDISTGIAFKVDKDLFKSVDDILIFFTYLPPLNSPFYNQLQMKGIFLLEEELLSLLSIYPCAKLLIIGDMNARTGQKNEFIDVVENIDFLEPYNDFLEAPSLEQRSSQDDVTSTTGNHLIDFCKIYSLYMLNGRTGDDNKKGHFTYISANGCSVIDYGLCSADLLQYISNFCVEEKCCSSHLPLRVKIDIKLAVSTNTENRKQTITEQIQYKLPRDKMHDCIKEAKTIFNDDCKKVLNEHILDLNTNINDIVQKFNNYMYEVGKHFEQKKKSTRNKPYTPWFDQVCKAKKSIKYKALRCFRACKSETNLNTYIQAKKEFKNICTEKQTLYNKSQVDDLSKSTNNPKSFWTKLKRMTNRNEQSKDNIISTEEWLNHFQSLLNPTNEIVNDVNIDENHINLDIETDSEIEEHIFNHSIQEDEIRLAIKHFKGGKQPGPDNILPEFFIYGIDSFIDILVNLFNRLYTFGEYPDKWCESIIITIYKKGDRNDPNNYRGISLQNVLSKIYCRVLVNRLNFYVELYSKISENQTGFKKGYSTIDNAFILNSIITHTLKSKRKKIYVAFIDFQKCFDTIYRPLLWEILREKGIKGKLFLAFKSMYKTVKSCIKCNNERSDYVNCSIGLKQGCLASPILFSLFIDDFGKYLQTENLYGIQLHPDTTQLLHLMFADDLALVSDSIMGLQKQLNTLSRFCDDYRLKVNETKSKVVVFKNGGILSNNEKWSYKNKSIEVVNKFNYVGLTFTRQMSLNAMVYELCMKSKRILTSILKSLYQYGQLPSSTFFKIFDTKICPQLLYGSEIWGIESKDELERCQYYACKRYMCAKQNACNYSVLGDCGRFPMYIQTQKRCIKYWLQILKMSNTRLVKKCYNMMLLDNRNGTNNWVSSIKNLLYSTGFGYIWENHGPANELLFLKSFETRLKDMFLQNWSASIHTNRKLFYYAQYKKELKFENYLNALDVRKFRYAYVNFRTSSHSLEIEYGRYNKVAIENRLCKCCTKNQIEDEYHFLLCCEFYSELRNQYIPNKYFRNTNIHKFKILMSSQCVHTIRAVATYIYHATKKRQSFLNMQSC
jgi:hypothetical protein